MTPTPIVLVLIDKDSRLRVLQTEEIQVALVDERVDRYGIVLLPRENQIEQIIAAIGDLKVISPTHDIANTAKEAVRRLKALGTVVATHHTFKKEA